VIAIFRTFLLMSLILGHPGAQAPAQNAGVNLSTVGANAQMSINKASSWIDPKAYTEVKMPTGEKVLWNQSSQSSYQVKGADGRILSRSTSNSSPNMRQMKISGAADIEGFAKIQGKLTEARAKVDLSQSYLKGLKLKSQAGMATAADKAMIKNLESNLPKYQKAYKGLHKQSGVVAASGMRSTVKAGFKGALTAAGIHAGISVLSDTMSNNGEVDLTRALSHMAQPSFIMGLGGGTVGSLLMSAIPVPGIGGGLLRALPAFLGGAVGFEVGAGSIDKVNWPRLIAGTAASAAAFGLIGGPVGIAASILAGIVVDQFFEDPNDENLEEMDPFVPDWGQLAQPGQGTQSMPSFAQMEQELPYDPNELALPTEMLQGRVGASLENQAPMQFGSSTQLAAPQAQLSSIQMENSQAPAVAQSAAAISAPSAPTVFINPKWSIKELQDRVRKSYDAYLKHVKAGDGVKAKEKFEEYRALNKELTIRRSKAN